MNNIKIAVLWICLVVVSFGAERQMLQKEFDEPLAFAIQSNDIKLLQKLKEAKVDFNAPLLNGKPPIFEAMFSKEREDAARFLLENGVDKKSVYYKKSILYNAVENHFSEEFVKYLLAIGCDKNYFKSGFTSNIDNNPYLYAKRYRSDFYSKDLLALLRPDDYDNKKLAFLYAKNRLYDDLIDFIEHISDVNVFQDPSSINLLEELTRTYPLEYELPKIQKAKAIEAMRLLMAKGADLNQTTMTNPNSFENIIFGKSFPKEFVTFALTLSNPNKKYYIQGRKTHWTPLFGAIATKNEEAFAELLKNGADVNYKDEDGLDAFYFAVFNGNIEMAKSVLAKGFALKHNQNTKRHPLAIAVLNSDIEMLKYLLSIGYDPKKELFGKKNLLEFALTSPNKDIGREQQPLSINLEMYRYLFESFKDTLNTPSDLGYHNLLLSKGGENAFEALKVLLDMGDDVHQNNKGYSPLQFLSEDEYFYQKAQILLAQKININNQDKDGDTPLHQFVIYSITTKEEMEKYENKKIAIETEKNDIADILRFVHLAQKKEFLERKKNSLELYKKTMKLLIEHGADVTLKNRQNQTAYQLAVHGKIEDNELLEWLKK